MHKELVVKTPSLSGSSELLVIAPIKPGFVPALDAVTYSLIMTPRSWGRFAPPRGL